MPRIMLLKGKNYVNTVSYINEAPVDDIWFVLLDTEQSLYEFLTVLHDGHGLKNSLLYRLKICRFLSWPGGALTYTHPDGKKHYPANLVALLKLLREPGPHEIVIENDDKTLLAEISQQLIYLRYPFANLKISL